MQIELEKKERQCIESLKAQEKAEATEELLRSMAKLEGSTHAESAGIVPIAVNRQRQEVEQRTSYIVPDEEHLPTSKNDVVGEEPPKLVANKSSLSGKADSSIDSMTHYFPQPRKKKAAKIRYTPRIFNTPMRESTLKTEQAFIVKNRPYLRKNRLLNHDALDLTESDPVWLKAKGDEFYQNRDFMSAINAYTAAFESDENMIQLVANRAACYLQIEELNRCVADCEYVLNKRHTFIESVYPNKNDAAMFQQKLLSRLSTAQCRLGNHDAALDTLKRAVALNPSDLKPQQDLELVSQWLLASSHKKVGDDKMIDGSLEEALKLYSLALELNPMFISALANRAACYFAQENLESCMQDCSTAIELIEKQPKSAPFPLLSRSKRREWIITIRTRRSSARKMAKDCSGALSDIEAAIAVMDDDSSYVASVKNEFERDRTILLASCNNDVLN